MKKDVVKNLVPEVELSLGRLHSALTGAVGQRWGQKRVGMDMELGVTLRSMAGARKVRGRHRCLPPLSHLSQDSANWTAQPGW